MVMNQVVEWIVTIGFGAVGAGFVYVMNRIFRHDEKHTGRVDDVQKELTKHQQETERRLGEFIRREELNSILDKYEHRIEKRFSELKDTIKYWMDRNGN